MKVKYPQEQLKIAQTNFERAGTWIKAQNPASLSEALNLRVAGAHWGDGSMLFQNALKRAVQSNLSMLVKEALELLERDVDQVRTAIATEIGAAVGLEAEDEIGNGAAHGTSPRPSASLRQGAVKSGMEPAPAARGPRKSPLGQIGH